MGWGAGGGEEGIERKRGIRREGGRRPLMKTDDFDCCSAYQRRLCMSKKKNHDVSDTMS